jgi:hypothetical protein
VWRPRRKKIVSGTAIPITMIPTIKRGPDMAVLYAPVLFASYCAAPVAPVSSSTREPRSCRKLFTRCT